MRLGALVDRGHRNLNDGEAVLLADDFDVDLVIWEKAGVIEQHVPYPPEDKILFRMSSSV